MSTAGPTAGAVHPTPKLRECLLDTDTARLRLFARGDPADPLIARERRNTLPRCSCRGRLYEGLS